MGGWSADPPGWLDIERGFVEDGTALHLAPAMEGRKDRDDRIMPQRRRRATTSSEPSLPRKTSFSKISSSPPQLRKRLPSSCDLAISILSLRYISGLCYKEEKLKKTKKLLWVGFISCSLVIFNISELKNFWAIDLL
ncbi:hypothetical protein LWI29_030926 [Acer saccharum]|uniref:Uncharacterized protein n=1 Tax=Acer saccharum TaxID=4024 RepID=A0AA39T9F7_ACESA|nr:hypothetical protein LWI29_030926 [Acer saccharum]